MAGLFFAQNVARPAQVHIVAGQRKARPQVIQGLHDLQTFLGGAGDLHTSRQGKIGVPLPPRSPYPSPQLVQLGQSKQMGTVDDQGVGPRDINPRFNNVGREQNIIPVIRKILHDGIQIRRRHLSVGQGQTGVWHQRLDILGLLGQILDTRADIENLALAGQLAQQSLPQGHIVLMQHKGFDGQTIHRRRGNQGQIKRTR